MTVYVPWIEDRALLINTDNRDTILKVIPISYGALDELIDETADSPLYSYMIAGRYTDSGLPKWTVVSEAWLAVEYRLTTLEPYQREFTPLPKL